MSRGLADRDGETHAETEGRRSTWISQLVPDPLAKACLHASIRAPNAFVAGEPSRFVLDVRNRAPLPIAVTLPTGRAFGWQIDGLDAADERGFDPPAQSRQLAFAQLETRSFVGRWDGSVRWTDGDRDRWRFVPGTHTLTAYLATADGPTGRLAVSTEVEVVER